MKLDLPVVTCCDVRQDKHDAAPFANPLVDKTLAAGQRFGAAVLSAQKARATRMNGEPYLVEKALAEYRDATARMCDRELLLTLKGEPKMQDPRLASGTSSQSPTAKTDVFKTLQELCGKFPEKGGNGADAPLPGLEELVSWEEQIPGVIRGVLELTAATASEPHCTLAGKALALLDRQAALRAQISMSKDGLVAALTDTVPAAALNGVPADAIASLNGESVVVAS